MEILLGDMGGGILMFSLLIAGVALLLFSGAALWIWATYDCLTREPRFSATGWVWMLLILLLPGIGAAIYLIVRRPRRMTKFGL